MRRPQWSSLRALIARAVALALGIALVWVVTRVLSGRQAGEFILLLTMSNVLATVGRAGTDNLALKLLSKDRPAISDGRRLALCCLATSSTISLAAGLCALAGTATLGLNSVATLLMAATIVPLAMSVFFGAILRSRLAHARGVLVEAGQQSALTILLVYVYDIDRLLPLVVAYGASCLFTCIAAGVWAWRVLARDSSLPPADPWRKFFRNHTSALASMTGVSTLYYASAYAPTLALGIVGDLEGVSVMAVATRVAAFVTLVPILRASFLSPTFARLHAAAEVAALNRTARTAARTDSMIALAAAFVLIASKDPIARWFRLGDSDLPLLLTILALGGVITAAQGQVNPLALTCGFERAAMVLSIVLLIAWSTVGLISTHAFGPVGTASVGAFLTASYALALSLTLRKSGGISSSPLVDRLTSAHADHDRRPAL